MTVADKILFTCTACSYKARIPSHYSGRSIHCPKCKTVQEVGAVAVADGSAAEASPDIAAPTTPAPGQGKIVFTCPSCSYKGRLAAEYDGKTIRCPGCQTPQLVKGEAVASPIVASMAADENVFKTGESDKIRFECNACGYRAKIPSKYAGKPIHCPQCKEVQQVKAETDLEAATGRTVTIARVSPAKVREPKLAMTNVGIAFECTVCGYASKISPSCAGDAVYCPSCRSPQKVEWGDPDEEEVLAEAAAAESADEVGDDDAVAEPAPPVAPPSATALSLQLGVNNTPLATPVLPEPTPPIAALPPEAPALMTEPSVQNEAEDEEPPLAPLALAPSAPARASAVQRPRRSVRSGSDTEEPAAPRAAARAAASTAPVAATPGKLPLIVLGAAAAIFLIATIVLFVQMNGLKSALAAEQGLHATQRQATAAETTAKQAVEGERDAANARADSEQARADTAEKTVADLTARVAGLETDVAGRDERLAAVNKELEAVTAELEAAKAAAAEKKTP